MEIKEISSLQNPIVKHCVHLRQNHDYRDQERSLIISGVKLISEISGIVKIKSLFVYNETFIPKNLKADVVYIVTEEIMQKASGLMHPEGIMAEVLMPEHSELKGLKKIIALDRVSDPGNLGNIMRTALALNYEGIFILKDSCDPYNDKALASARGATFKLPIAQGNWDDLKKIIELNQLYPIAGDIEGTPLDQVKKQEKILIVLGHEAHGLSDDAKNICQKVLIPISKQMESLNVAVAAGILMYELGK